MKICFVIYGNLYLTPYIRNYLSEMGGQEIDILLWDRHGTEESAPGCRVLSYRQTTQDNRDGKVKKLLGYLKYTAFVRRHLKRNGYDLVVCLQSIGGVFNARTLLRRYRGRYIMDVRDYSIEGLPVLRNIEYKLLRHSRLNVISSEGYKNFLPADLSYRPVHNYSHIDESVRAAICARQATPPFRLSYIGLIRFQEQNKKIIDLFAGDSRFEIRFIGKNALELEAYARRRGADNVVLTDQFPPEKTLDYYAETDAILNVYGNHTPLLDYALSNKLYFAAALHMPILVSPDTFMETVSVGGGFGFVLDLEDPGSKDSLYRYMTELDRARFADRCDAFMEKVRADNEMFAKTIRQFIAK